MFVATVSSLHSQIPRSTSATWPTTSKSWNFDQGSTVRGCGSDTSGTTGVSCMDGSYLSQGTAQRARRRERAAYFDSKQSGAVACFDVRANLCRDVNLLAGPPWRPIGPQGSGVRFPVAGQRWDRPSEASRRRTAPRANARASCEVTSPAPRTTCTTPPTCLRTPLVRARALPAFTTSPPSPPLILPGDTRSRWSIRARAKGAPAALSQPRAAPCQRPSRHRERRQARPSCWGRRRRRCGRPLCPHAVCFARARRHACLGAEEPAARSPPRQRPPATARRRRVHHTFSSTLSLTHPLLSISTTTQTTPPFPLVAPFHTPSPPAPIAMFYCPLRDPLMLAALCLSQT